MSPAEQLAALFHRTYEDLAPTVGYQTRKASAVPWEQVPETNRTLMIAVAERVLAEWPSSAEGGQWDVEYNDAECHWSTWQDRQPDSVYQRRTWEGPAEPISEAAPDGP